MTVDANKEKVLNYQMAVSELLKDPSAKVALEDHLAPTVTWHLPASLEAFGGARFDRIDGVRQMLTENIRRFYLPETITVDFRSMMGEGDLVHMHFGMAAKTPGGQDYANDYQILYEVKDGLITNVWEYFDAHILIQTLA